MAANRGVWDGGRGPFLREHGGFFVGAAHGRESGYGFADMARSYGLQSGRLFDAA